jgi:hypothetical protein
MIIWVVASIIFFNYRNNKLRKAGIKWAEDMKKKLSLKVELMKK